MQWLGLEEALLAGEFVADFVVAAFGLDSWSARGLIAGIVAVAIGRGGVFRAGCFVVIIVLVRADRFEFGDGVYFEGG